MIGRDGDLFGQIAGSAWRAGVDEVLLSDLPVDDRVTVLDAHRVARARNDPLDEVDARLLRGRPVAGGPARAAGTGPRVAALAADAAAVGALRWMEDDDVTDLRVGEVVEKPVDQDPLADVQRGLHRLGGDLVRLDDEGLDPQREPESERDDDDELEERALGAVRPWNSQSSAFSGAASAVASGSGSWFASASSPPASPVASPASLPGVSAPSSGLPSSAASPSSSGGGSTSSASASVTATPSESTA